MAKGKTHFGDYDEPAICGYDSENVAENWEDVTCKKCLHLKDRYIESMKRAMDDSIKDMEGFVNFMNKSKV